MFLRVRQWAKVYVFVGQGYSAIQRTKPQTLGYALADSPVALLAWIYEKLVTWTDAYPWEDDEGDPYPIHRTLNRATNYQLYYLYTVLAWVSLYLFSTPGPAASVRIYYEVNSDGQWDSRSTVWSNSPLGLSYFPRELRVVPKTYVSAFVTATRAQY